MTDNSETDSSFSIQSTREASNSISEVEYLSLYREEITELVAEVKGALVERIPEF